MILQCIHRAAGILRSRERGARHTHTHQSSFPAGQGTNKTSPCLSQVRLLSLTCLFARCQSEIPPTSGAQPRAGEGEDAGMEQRCLGAAPPLPKAVCGHTSPNPFPRSSRNIPQRFSLPHALQQIIKLIASQGNSAGRDTSNRTQQLARRDGEEESGDAALNISNKPSPRARRNQSSSRAPLSCPRALQNSLGLEQVLISIREAG